MEEWASGYEDSFRGDNTLLEIESSDGLWLNIIMVQYYVVFWHLKWGGGCGSSGLTMSHPPESTPLNKVP